MYKIVRNDSLVHATVVGMMGPSPDKKMSVSTTIADIRSRPGTRSAVGARFNQVYHKFSVIWIAYKNIS